MNAASINRELNAAERSLLRWMIERGEPEALTFLDQLERAEVTPERCPCGCASLNFQIRGEIIPPPGIHPIAKFVFEAPEGLSGIFVYEQSGILGGLEVYGLPGNAPKELPTSEMLQPFPPSCPN